MYEEWRCHSGTWASWQGHDLPFSLNTCSLSLGHLTLSHLLSKRHAPSRQCRCDFSQTPHARSNLEMLWLCAHVRHCSSPLALRVWEQEPRLVCVLISTAPGAQQKVPRCQHEWRRRRMPGTTSPTERSDCATTDVLRKDRSQGDPCPQILPAPKRMVLSHRVASPQLTH